MQFSTTACIALLAGVSFAKTSISTVWGDMTITALSSDTRINNKPLLLTSNNQILIGASSGKNLTVIIDSTDNALYVSTAVKEGADIPRIYLDNEEWKISGTANPVLSPASFTNDYHLTVGGKQLGYACRENDGYSVHWGETPKCSGSADLKLQLSAPL